MSVIKTHPQPITGLWNTGIALDFHTTSSTPIGENPFGYMQFDTIRTDIAELLYQLKYRGNQRAASDIIDTAAHFLTPHHQKFDIIVPVPPSMPRAVQPVLLLAKGIGAALTKPVMQCVRTTRPTPQLKQVTDPEERMALLDGLYTVDAAQTQGKSVLLFDDLFRSGATMNAITSILLGEGAAAVVRAFTITKTRSNQ